MLSQRKSQRVKLEIKKLIEIHQSSEMHWVGNGFPVRSVFDYNGLGRQLSPFLLLDYVAPYKFLPGNERRGVDTHPHKGFETVTIAYQGEVEHRDSSGGGGIIGAGDVQWMTAGNGIVHQEFHSQEFVRKGGTFQMVQLWINLPAKDKSTKAGYQTLSKSHIPVVSLPESEGNLRVVAGEFNGTKGPARTFTPINFWDVNLHAGKTIELPVPSGHTTAFLVLSGILEVNQKHKAIEGELAIFSRSGNTVVIKTKTDCQFLLMDGEPINEPIVGYGPFVMNSEAEIKQAFEEFQLGQMGELSK